MDCREKATKAQMDIVSGVLKVDALRAVQSAPTCETVRGTDGTRSSPKEYCGARWKARRPNRMWNYRPGRRLGQEGSKLVIEGD